MKGRARQQSAKFYAFADCSGNQSLSLKNAQTVEGIVHQFIANREEKYVREFNQSLTSFTHCELECAEETAMHNEVYKTNLASIDLSSSKSLLNRYALSVPIDPSYRTSKQAILRKFHITFLTVKWRMQHNLYVSLFLFQSTCHFTKSTR